jgi:uncharacterized protein
VKKIRLDIVGLSYSQTQTGAYALVLGESNGKRRLPIIIGGFEAQAIAIELEKMTPSRPLTHDLFKTFADNFDIAISEIIIYQLTEGIFYSRLVCTNADREIEIDARTSDAIALAVRFGCPIFTYENIMSTAGIMLENETEGMSEEGLKELLEEDADTVEKENKVSTSDYKNKSTEELKSMLQNALDDEKYELASNIRDELNNRKKS